MASDARLNALAGVVLDAEATAIGWIVERAAVGSLDHVIGDHPVAIGTAANAATAILDPLAAPASTTAHRFTEALVPGREQLSVDLLGWRLNAARIDRWHTRLHPRDAHTWPIFARDTGGRRLNRLDQWWLKSSF